MFRCSAKSEKHFYNVVGSSGTSSNLNRNMLQFTLTLFISMAPASLSWPTDQLQEWTGVIWSDRHNHWTKTSKFSYLFLYLKWSQPNGEIVAVSSRTFPANSNMRAAPGSSIWANFWAQKKQWIFVLQTLNFWDICYTDLLFCRWNYMLKKVLFWKFITSYWKDFFFVLLSHVHLNLNTSNIEVEVSRVVLCNSYLNRIHHCFCIAIAQFSNKYSNIYKEIIKIPIIF